MRERVGDGWKERINERGMDGWMDGDICIDGWFTYVSLTTDGDDPLLTHRLLQFIIPLQPLPQEHSHKKRRRYGECRKKRRHGDIDCGESNKNGGNKNHGDDENDDGGV